jgi:hypothetical protein
MNKLALLAFSIALSTLAGCAVPVQGDEAPSAEDEAASKKGKKTRDDRIQECKDACYGGCVPCTGGWTNPFGRLGEAKATALDDKPGLAEKGVGRACNPEMSPDLGPNPFCIMGCDDECAKTP